MWINAQMQWITNFNPRSREGSDVEHGHNLVTKDGFQSTLPRRERRKTKIFNYSIPRISIHAPAKGATPAEALLPAPLRHFNPRSREGSDASHLIKSLASSAFQSTLPRRERRKDRVQGLFTHSFQSTLPRRERQSRLGKTQGWIAISIHAPAKGATTLNKEWFA